jgi:hypothetical protein
LDRDNSSNFNYFHRNNLFINKNNQEQRARESLLISYKCLSECPLIDLGDMNETIRVFNESCSNSCVSFAPSKKEQKFLSRGKRGTRIAYDFVDCTSKIRNNPDFDQEACFDKIFRENSDIIIIQNDLISRLSDL